MPERPLLSLSRETTVQSAAWYCNGQSMRCHVPAEIRLCVGKEEEYSDCASAVRFAGYAATGTAVWCPHWARQRSHAHKTGSTTATGRRCDPVRHLTGADSAAATELIPHTSVLRSRRLRLRGNGAPPVKTFTSELTGDAGWQRRTVALPRGAWPAFTRTFLDGPGGAAASCRRAGSGSG